LSVYAVAPPSAIASTTNRYYLSIELSVGFTTIGATPISEMNMSFLLVERVVNVKSTSFMLYATVGH
jgi:hypothetical protein